MVCSVVFSRNLSRRLVIPGSFVDISNTKFSSYIPHSILHAPHFAVTTFPTPIASTLV